MFNWGGFACWINVRTFVKEKPNRDISDLEICRLSWYQICCVYLQLWYSKSRFKFTISTWEEVCLKLWFNVELKYSACYGVYVISLHIRHWIRTPHRLPIIIQILKSILSYDDVTFKEHTCLISFTPGITAGMLFNEKVRVDNSN